MYVALYRELVTEPEHLRNYVVEIRGGGSVEFALGISFRAKLVGYGGILKRGDPC